MALISNGLQLNLAGAALVQLLASGIWVQLPVSAKEGGTTVLVL